MKRNADSVAIYIRAVVDQVEAAAARDDRDGIRSIIDRVHREQGPRAAAALTLAILEHADECKRARIRGSLDGDIP